MIRELHYRRTLHWKYVLISDVRLHPSRLGSGKTRRIRDTASHLFGP